MARLTDDRLGRALDHLFDAVRVAFCGQYRAATGRQIRGRSAPAIVHGFSKDHRPDLKQLLFILSVTADGVPASFRCADGNTGDAVPHVETWETLRQVAGRPDFLYVADSRAIVIDGRPPFCQALTR